MPKIKHSPMTPQERDEVIKFYESTFKRRHDNPDKKAHEANIGLSPQTGEYETTAESVEQLQNASTVRSDLSPVVTELLAKMGIYTTTIAQDPGDYEDFKKKRKVEKKLQEFRKEIHESLDDLEGIDPDQLGLQLRLLFNKASKNVKVNNLHIDLKRENEPTAIADSIVYTFDNKEDAVLMSHVLQRFFGDKQKASARNLVDRDDKRVILSNVTEHDVSFMEQVGREMFAEYLAEKVEWKDHAGKERKGGIKLPSYKVPWKRWVAEGETFPPFLQKLMEETDAAYQDAKTTIKYNVTYNEPKLKEELRQPDVYESHLGSGDACAQITKDAFRPLLHHVIERRANTKPEQDPDELRRPGILTRSGVEFTREVDAAVEGAIPGFRTANLREVADKKLSDSLKEGKDILKDPGANLSKLAHVTGTAIDKLGGLGATEILKGLAFGSKTGVDKIQTNQEWKAVKKVAAQGVQDTINALNRLYSQALTEKRIEEDRRTEISEEGVGKSWLARTGRTGGPLSGEEQQQNTDEKIKRRAEIRTNWLQEAYKGPRARREQQNFFGRNL